jgi:hypothetical protein
MTTRHEIIDLGRIIQLDECRMRLTLNRAKVLEYAARIRDGETPPELELTDLPDGRLVITNGVHRLEALKEVGHEQMACNIQPGNLHDAMLRAAAADNDTPLNRSPDDKRFALRKVLTIPDVADTWPKSRLARMFRVTRKVVEEVAEELYPGWASRERQLQVERNGAQFSLRTPQSTRQSSVAEAQQHAAAHDQMPDMADVLNHPDDSPPVPPPPAAPPARPYPTSPSSGTSRPTAPPTRHVPDVIVTSAHIQISWTMPDGSHQTITLDDPDALLHIPPGVRRVLEDVFRR